MNTEQILKVLKNERECIARQNGKCDRDCAKCDVDEPKDIAYFNRILKTSD